MATVINPTLTDAVFTVLIVDWLIDWFCTPCVHREWWYANFAYFTNLYILHGMRSFLEWVGVYWLIPATLCYFIVCWNFFLVFWTFNLHSILTSLLYEHFTGYSLLSFVYFQLPYYRMLFIIYLLYCTFCFIAAVATSSEIGGYIHEGVP